MRRAALLLLLAAPAHAADPLPTGADLAAATARRFPQAVQADSLLRREVLAPSADQAVLGTVRQVVQGRDGTPSVIVDTGGLLGFGTHAVAVPTAALALLGRDLVLVGFTSRQFRDLPTASEGAPLAPGTVLQMGLAKPSH